MKIKQISTLFIVLFLTLTNCKKEDENISEPDPNATISEVRFYTNKGDFVVELEDKLIHRSFHAYKSFDFTK